MTREMRLRKVTESVVDECEVKVMRGRLYMEMEVFRLALGGSRIVYCVS